MLFLALEEQYKRRGGRLPRKIYLTLDGGSENANFMLLGMIELLIAADVGVEEFWFCRMPVGHNHGGINNM